MIPRRLPAQLRLARHHRIRLERRAVMGNQVNQDVFENQARLHTCTSTYGNVCSSAMIKQENP